ILALDCAAVNEQVIDKLRTTLEPAPTTQQMRFQPLDFSAGLPICASEYFDGVVSGLAIQYAEHYSEEDGCWTTGAYDHLLAETYRVLRGDGRWVFSVNVPEPSWGRVALHSLWGMFRARRPARYLKTSFRMLRYGAWLSREARRGRFHYLPISVIVDKLQRT